MEYREALQVVASAVQQIVGFGFYPVTSLVGLNPQSGCEAVQRRHQLIAAAIPTASIGEISAMGEEIELCRLFYAIYAFAGETGSDIPITTKDTAIIRIIVDSRLHGYAFERETISQIAHRIHPALPF
jgi:hypothetical protein